MSDRPPPHDDPPGFEAQHPPVDASRLLVALLAGGVGAAIGGMLAGYVGLQIGLLLPLAGAGAGYAALMFYSRRHRGLTAGIAVASFMGAVFSETYTNDLSAYSGTLDYMLHFYENDLTIDWVFRVLNVIVGVWFCRRD